MCGRDECFVCFVHFVVASLAAEHYVSRPAMLMSLVSRKFFA